MSALLSDIEIFLMETGMGPFRFGLRAARNGRLVARLREGRRVWPETELQIRAFMEVERRQGVDGGSLKTRSSIARAPRSSIKSVASVDPAKVSAAPPSAVSQPDAERFACAEKEFPKPRKSFARAG